MLHGNSRSESTVLDLAGSVDFQVLFDADVSIHIACWIRNDGCGRLVFNCFDSAGGDTIAGKRSMGWKSYVGKEEAFN